MLIKLFIKSTLCVCVMVSIINIGFAQEKCAPKGSFDQDMHIHRVVLENSEGKLYGLLDKYLARSVMLSGFINHQKKEDYLAQIELIKVLRPAYLSRIAGSWGLPETQQLPIGGSIYAKTKSLMNDIRKVYCQEGLSQPIIEAGIYEAVTEDIDKIEIPKYVSDAFQTDPDYRDADYDKSLPSFFNVDSIKSQEFLAWSPGSWTPDINRIQTRMWFYYLSTIYIDMGCNALHMGWFDRVFVNDSLYVKTHHLFQLIRKYARELDTFVIINADVDRAVYYNNTDQFIFDFITSPIRPEPVNSYYGNTPCAGEPMTELNFTEYFPYLLNSAGGISPTGERIETIPVLFNLDWYGVGYKGMKPPQTGFEGKGWSPWGVNETIWFYNLAADCQAYWLKSVGDEIKNKLIPRGYLKMPMIQDLTWWGYPVDQYLMTEFSTVTTVINEDIWWTADSVEFTMESGRMSKSSYLFKVKRPQITSIYTWHVHNLQSGEWLEYSYGNEREVELFGSEEFMVYLREDNWILGSRIKAKKLSVPQRIEQSFNVKIY